MKDIIREVKRSFARFLSILLIVAMGVGFFVGVKATAPSIYKSGEERFNKSHMMDLEVLSTVGFSKEDAEAVRAVEGVDRVQVSYALDALYNLDDSSEDESGVVKLISLSADSDNAINEPVLLEGRLPESKDECVIYSGGQYEGWYYVGEVVNLADMAGDTVVDDVVNTRSFTIVGLVDMPQYFSYQLDNAAIGGGVVDIAIMVPEEVFTFSRYTIMYLTLDCHEQGISGFSKEYEEIVDNIKGQLEGIGEIQYKIFSEEISKELEQAEDDLQEGEDQAESEISKYKKELEDAHQAIEEARDKIRQGWEEYYAGEKDAAQMIADAEKDIANYEKILEDSAKEIQSGWATFRAEKANGEAQLAAARAELDNGWAQYQNAEQQLLDAEQQISDAESSIANAKSQVETSKKFLEEANTMVSSMKTLLGTAGNFNYQVDDTELSQLKNYLSQAETQRDNTAAQMATLDPSSTEYSTVQSTNQVYTSIANILSNRITALEADPTMTSAELQSDVDAMSAEITNAQNTINQAETVTIPNAETELANAKVEYEAAKADFESGTLLQQLNDGETQYAAGVAEFDTEINSGRQQLEAAEKEWKDGVTELNEAKKTFETEKANAEVELEAAKKELDVGEEELQDAEEEYEEGLEEYNAEVAKVEAELSDARSQILNGRNIMSELVTGKWYVFDRDDVVVQYANLKADAERITTIADVFPVFFLMVAALVCLTTMTRLIDEQRIQMGTYKALGYTQGEIASKYLIYAASAAVCGCIIGPIIGVTVLPRVIFGAYAVLYTFENYMPTLPIMLIVISVAVALACTVLVAAICCFRELRVTTAQMMRPKAPKVGKKIFLEKIPGLWNRFSFFQKLTARNLLRYKIRFLMTVVGIAGCMTLVVAGFGLMDAMDPIMEFQFQDIQKIDAMMLSDGSLTEEEIESISADMDEDERIEAYLPCNLSSVKAYDVDDSKMMDEIYLTVPLYPDQISSCMNLRTVKGHDEVELTDEGAVVSDKIARRLGLSIGDKFQILINDERYEVKLAGIVENYIYNYIYMTPGYYLEAVGDEVPINTFYITEGDEIQDKEEFIDDWLINCESFINVSFVADVADLMNDTLNSLKLVVIVIIICAGGLAFVVLFNLTNINIAERLREIATVKVLGFNHKETNSYVFKENLIMSMIGILAGCFFGYLMARYLVGMLEVNTITFYSKVRFVSYLYSAGLTMLFTICVNFFMRKHIRDISMVESLKAVE